MFEGATSVKVVKKGLSRSFDSWDEAYPNIEVGDQLRGLMPDGTMLCAEALSLIRPPEGSVDWELVLRPC
jgi:hypothetical protein